MGFRVSKRERVIMPRNEAPDNTIMRDVPAGEETGIYYILISGLPFGTIWQLLKDWLRQAGCDVDHIEVFQKSTSGWIRLIGKHNFERALLHLQTVPYNNRLLLYLAKNRTESVKIMELIDDPPPKPKLGGGGGSQASRSKSRFRAQVNASDKAVGDYKGKKNRSPTIAAAVRYPSLPVSEAASPPLGCYYVASPELFDESRSQYGVMAEPFGPPPSAWSVPHAPPVYGPFHHRALEPPGSPASSSMPRDPLPGYRLLRYEPSGRAPDSSPRALPHDVDSDRCRVMIDPLRKGVTLADVEGWVRSFMGEWASALSRVEVVGMSQRSGGGPGGGGVGRVRPFAYVTFLSSAAAQRAVELLNSKPLRSRSVVVRLVDDEPCRGFGRDEAHYGARRSSSDGRLPLSPPLLPPSLLPPPPIPSTVRQSESASGLGGSTITKSDATNAPPVIAHGTFYRPKTWE
ncbi:hypothetical protein CP533_4668 [Ophiocordyceps camponoti-saundersi (nom. inval.)]|nr:hypothetical protein CP533_4668 [Ophiocordyceps camponoti-saundersi (nom. inval.)]